MTKIGVHKESNEAEEVGPCVMCEAEGCACINDQWFCVDHVNDGFQIIFRTVAILKGADPDMSEALGQAMLSQLLDADEGFAIGTLPEDK